MDVGIVVYNRNNAIYLKECLSSIAEQINTPKSVIVVEDNSDKESDKPIREITFKRFAEENLNIKARMYDMPDWKNGNKAYAMSHMASAMENKWIMFMNSDDVIPPNFLTTASDLVESRNREELKTDWIYSDVFKFGMKGKEAHIKTGAWDELYFRANGIRIPSIIVGREVYEYVGGIDTDTTDGYELYELIIRLNKAGAVPAYNNKVFVGYRDISKQEQSPYRMRRYLKEKHGDYIFW